MAETEKLGLGSKDLVAERVEEMRDLFPEVFTEDGIDFNKLRLFLGDEVDEGEERYAFTWPGKAAAIRQSQTVSTATLRPCEKESVSADGTPGSWEGTENLYIEGDNLEVLKLLQAGYHGKVKLIYIDPPYNTGHDFVYKDKFGDTIENYKEQTAQADQSNPETAGRYHANWCSMMYPRLRLTRELLSDDGAVFISIDDNELANLQRIVSEIFGDINVIATLIVTVKPEGRRYGAFAKTHEYILVAAKDGSLVSLNEVPAERASFSYSDSYGGFNLQGLRNRNVRAFNSLNRPNLRYPFFVDTNASPLDGIYQVSVDKIDGWDKVFPSVVDGLESVWRWGKDKARSEIADLGATRGSDGNWRVFQKVRSLTQTPKTTWISKYYQSNWGTRHVADLLGPGIFDYPKPVDLLAQIVRIGSNNDSLILDFFSGSGTLAEATLRVKSETDGLRRYISVQLPEPCSSESPARKAGFTTLCEIGKERIRRAGKKIAAEVDEANQQLKLGEEPKRLPDIGFRVLKLDESGIVKPEPGQLLVDVVKPGRTELDLVFECMLKWGLEPSLPVERAQAAGYPVWEVAAGELVCCMAPGLTVEALEAVAAMEPRRVLILDSVLDDTLKLNAKAIFDRGCADGTEIELRTV